MSRPLSPPTYDGLAYERLHALVSEYESEPVESQSPTKWFDQALRQAETARQAERRNSKSSMYVAYTRLAIAYQKCRTHPRFKDAKAADPKWAARVSEFKSTFELALRKAKVLKGELKMAEGKGIDSPPPLESPPTLEEHGGSIADRMKALRGHGMDVGSSSSNANLIGHGRPSGTKSGAAAGAAHGTAPTRQQPASPPAPTPATVPAPAPRPIAPQPLSRPASRAAGPRPPSTTGEQHSHADPAPKVIPHTTGASSKSQTSNTSLGSPIKSPGGLSRPMSLGGSSSSTATSPARDKHPLPHLPTSPSPVENGADEAGAMDRFSAAFPSLDDLGKQFDDDGFAVPALPPINGTNGKRAPLPEPPSHAAADTQGDAAEFLSFPTLPSVPTELPGHSLGPKKPLPPPPNRPDDLEMRGGPPSPPHLDAEVGKHPSPPQPDLRQDPNRPASTLGFTEQSRPLSGTPDDDLARRFAALSASSRRADKSDHARSSSPPDTSSRAPTAPSVPPPPARHRDASAVASPTGNASPLTPSLSFPVPSPGTSSKHLESARPPVPSSPRELNKRKKPDFPLTNSIVPSTLREYLLDPAVDVLLLDVRPEEEFMKGFVGAEYHNRRHVHLVWLDPNVLMRSNLTTSEQLEDALSLSTDAQRLDFENRHRYDLVVVYDSRSASFPAKGAPATPVSRLWSIIAENEFVKPLPRFPTLLLGGYDGWLKFIKARGEMHAREFARQRAEHRGVPERAAAPPSPQALASPRLNGHPPPTPLGRRPSNSSLSSGSRRDKYVSGGTDRGENAYGPPSASFSSHKYSGSMASPSGYSYQHPASSPPSRPGMPRTSHASSQSISSFGSSTTLSQTPSSYSSTSTIAAPPRASVHASAMTRRQSSGYDNQGYTGYSPSRSSIDYPQAHALVQVPQPPPPAVSHALTRQDQRMPRSLSARNVDQLVPNSGVRFWLNTKLGLTGLKNLGNTCYMNSTIQCLSATLPFARFFLDGRYKHDINELNPLGTKGDLADTFAKLLSALWGENWNVLSPISFRKSIVSFKPDFGGTDQHDSQEFLSFVMDGLHEDLNRIKVKPKPVEMTPEREHALETLPPQIASDREWSIYKQRNDSFIVDLFQGQYMNRMECLTCHKTSTVYDSFQWLTLDLPPTKAKVVLPELMDRWVKPEILDGDDKWYCPKCKTHRRASKTLTLVRLPPVLLIQLKRFIPVNGGRFWDKSETPVIFPLKGLDLTRFVPPRQAEPGMDFNDPRTQVGPFKYDLYGVSNHMGTLSSGHYTAYVRSSDQWMYCEDSRVTPAREVDVVSRPAYILFYKRVPAQ